MNQLGSTRQQTRSYALFCRCTLYTPLLESEVYSTEYKSDGQYEAAGQEPLFIVKRFFFALILIKCA